MTRGKVKKTVMAENEPEIQPKIRNSVQEKTVSSAKPSQSQELYHQFKQRLMQIPKKNEIAAWIDEEDKKLRHLKCVMVDEKNVHEKRKVMSLER